MAKHTIGLVQINNSFANQNYFPYSVGILQAYAQKYLSNSEDFSFLTPLYKRIPVKEAVGHLKHSDAAFFSVYTWNINISLEIARQLKAANKDILIVFGGPQIPAHGIEAFLKSNPFINAACHGEGEKPFLKLLENIDSRDWSQVPNLSYLKTDGTLIKNPAGVRTEDLNEIPSPYLQGVFDPLMKANPEENWVALWETNRGCPFSCSYCVWGASTNKKVYERNLDAIKKEMDWFGGNKIEFIFCCDANFGILPRDIQLAEYTAETKRKHGYPKALSVQNTKNSTMRVYNIYKTLADAGLNKGVSLAIQSVNPPTLKSIKRENISLNIFRELQEKFNENGIETYTDVILGLPCETYDTFADGVAEVIGSGQHNKIQFANLSILSSSEMDDPAYLKEYGILTASNKLINVHGSLSDTNEIEERQNLVIGSKAMPKTEWIRARVFGWMTALMHFDKLIQIPLILMAYNSKLSFRALIESLIKQNDKDFPLLSYITCSFTAQAESIQKGGAEFAESKEWLGIWWPPEELMTIRMCAENKLDALYKEVEAALSSLLKSGDTLPQDALTHALALNKALIKLPFNNDMLNVELPYNIWEFYRSVLTGKQVPLQKGSYKYVIDRKTQKWLSWEEWCREVIWYSSKRSAYLYPCKNSKEL